MVFFVQVRLRYILRIESALNDYVKEAQIMTEGILFSYKTDKAMLFCVSQNCPDTIYVKNVLKTIMIIFYVVFMSLCIIYHVYLFYFKLKAERRYPVNIF